MIFSYAKNSFGSVKQTKKQLLVVLLLWLLRLFILFMLKERKSNGFLLRFMIATTSLF